MATNPDFDAVLKGIRTAISHRDAKVQELNNTCKEAAIDLLETYCEKYRTPGLTHIFIIGHTPSWNDGEECTHDTRVFIENDSNYSDVEEYFEQVTNNFDADTDELLPLVNSCVEKETAKKLQSEVYSELDNVLQSVFITDFNISIRFLDGKIKIDVEDYDCGY